MNLNKRKEYFEEKLQKWHERIYALKVKGDINGDVSQKLEYLISLMLAKALPEYIPFEIEGIYDETGAIIMYVDLLMLKLTGSKVPVSVLKRCREKLWLDSCEIDEMLDLHGYQDMMIRPEKGNISENGVVSLGCDALTDLTADEVLSVVEKRLKIEIGVCKRAGRFTQDRFDFTGQCIG